MEKPVSVPIKEWIIRKISAKSLLSEKVVETVINHQFESAHKALVNSYTIEFSGWGKFYFNKPKAIKMVERYKQKIEVCEKDANDQSLPPHKRHVANLKLVLLMNNLELLKAKLGNENTSGQNI